MLGPLTGDKGRAGAIAATTRPTSGLTIILTPHRPHDGLEVETLDHEDDDHGGESGGHRAGSPDLPPPAQRTGSRVVPAPHAFRKSVAPTNLRSRRRHPEGKGPAHNA